MRQIDRIRLSTAAVALLAVASLTGTRAVAEPMVYTPPPGAAPPWAGTSTTTMTTETKTANSPAAIPAHPTAQPVIADTGITAPDQITATPTQGTTTPKHAVFLHSAPMAGSPVIGTLRPGTVLHVLASANPGWTQVETPAGTGWAWGSYLAPVSSPNPQ